MSIGKHQVNYAETTAREADVKQAFASQDTMSGLMLMLWGLDVANTPKTSNQCRFLTWFFETAKFYRMEPHDELAARGTMWLLTDGDRSYITFAEAGYRAKTVFREFRGRLVHYVSWFVLLLL